jgi:phosphate acetyltransferase
MSDIMEGIRRTARSRIQRLLFAEAEDDRIVRAADRVAREGLARVGFVGDPERLRATARRADVTLGAVETIDALSAAEIARTLAALRESRGEKLTAADAEKYPRDPLFQAAARVRLGLADLFVAGASRTTADVLRATLWLIGLAPGVRTLSSFFLMVVPGGGGAPDRELVFADCAVVPDPTPEQLAEIGIMSADSFARLTRRVPHTAFLSFSTRGSATHPRVDKVRQAVEIARGRRPDLHFDGELQADAALVPDVARRKASDSVVAGHADVLIFPDLDAGNIGYKLVQRLAGAKAYGPILMGPARQANDLSRGCSTDDVIETATIACAVSGALATATV